MSPTESLLRAYDAAMSNVRWPNDIAEADIRFWRKKKTEQPRVAVKIMVAHYDRCVGDGSPSLCDAALNEAIRSLR